MPGNALHVETWKIRGGGFHFGEHGRGQETTMLTFPSDSLFAALLARLAEREGGAAVDDFVRPFRTPTAGEAPPLRLTSTFPFVDQVRLYPLPLNALRSPQMPAASAAAEHSHVKDLKKVKYLSESLFLQILQGQAFETVYRAAHKLQGGQVIISPDEFAGLPVALQLPEARLWVTEQRPRVTIGRADQKSNLFFTGRSQFAEQCGLWFGIAWGSANPTMKQQVLAGLDDLNAWGLGADRSAGFGGVAIAKDQEIDLPAADGRPWVSLSRYLPAQVEMSAFDWRGAAYSLRRVGGWLQSNQYHGQRRRAIHLLAEGSVLGALETPAFGRIEDVQPVYQTDGINLAQQHPVYRPGIAFPVGLVGGAA